MLWAAIPNQGGGTGEISMGTQDLHIVYHLVFYIKNLFP